MSEHDELLAQANTALEGSGYIATHLGPDSVGVQGDTRVFGPSVVIDIGFNDGPPEWDRVSKYATEIINQVPTLTRVLVDITSPKT